MAVYLSHNGNASAIRNARTKQNATDNLHPIGRDFAHIPAELVLSVDDAFAETRQYRTSCSGRSCGLGGEETEISRCGSR
jgi:hypothetical protein